MERGGRAGLAHRFIPMSCETCRGGSQNALTEGSLDLRLRASVVRPRESQDLS
jgi:hypothetical protein